MNSRKLIVVLSAVGAAVGVFALGDSYGQRTVLKAVDPQYNGIQAILAYNRLDDDRKLGVLLAQGHSIEAQDMLDLDEDLQTRLLSEFFKGDMDQESIQYVMDRDPKLVASLKTFKSKYSSASNQPK